MTATDTLRERYERAFLLDWKLRPVGGAPRLLQRLNDEFAQLLAEDDPEAMEMHAEGIVKKEQRARRRIGRGPFDGAQDWPKALGRFRGPVINVPATAPIHGWRMWSVENDRLLAPVILSGALNGVDVLDSDPGVTWQPGTNHAVSAHCTRQLGVPAVKRPGPHPNRRCRCGIRIMQSLTALEAYDSSHAFAGCSVSAWARVAVWGRVAPWVPDDDWPFTARAEYAEIVGDLMLPDDAEHLRPGLVARYGEALA